MAICTIRFFFSNNSALRPAFEFIRFFSGEVILVILFGSAFSVLGEGVYFQEFRFDYTIKYSEPMIRGGGEGHRIMKSQRRSITK